ncbi:MAG: hypothetical protein KL787_02435 [Taibaiella sp.]|nr:hypothetical protein [Taibaiella sp.]
MRQVTVLLCFFANQSSSLDTDIRHQNSIQDPGQFYPGPAIFVYTLPNIAIGEVSIRHQLQTESMFLIQEVYDRESLKRQGGIFDHSSKIKNGAYCLGRIYAGEAISWKMETV